MSTDAQQMNSHECNWSRIINVAHVCCTHGYSLVASKQLYRESKRQMYSLDKRVYIIICRCYYIFPDINFLSQNGSREVMNFVLKRLLIIKLNQDNFTCGATLYLHIICGVSQCYLVAIGSQVGRWPVPPMNMCCVAENVKILNCPTYEITLAYLVS